MLPVRSIRCLIIGIAMLLANKSAAQKIVNTELVIFGAGASGTTAAIQASRMGIKTILIEETNWLGGMLTSAGVSAIDGNHNLASGLWAEFREKLYLHYGGAKQVETGWVSNTLFEPSVGNKLLKEMAVNPNLTIYYLTDWQKVTKKDKIWQTEVIQHGKKILLNSKLIVDATELGDVMAYLKIPYRLGMDSRLDTKEKFAPERANNIVQDITYAVTLKDFGKGADKTIPKPLGYDPKEFACACDVSDPSLSKQVNLDCDKMLNYGKLPNHKYMINWPKCGNDIYLNLVELSKKDRLLALEKAKLHSLRFIYYLQTVLGYKNLGLADDEFTTKDKLPLIPYHRESRRVKGLITLTVNDLIDPYTQESKLYRTGIAVGDYPIDHHHEKNKNAPKIDFINIKVPSYSIPLGALIPENTKGILIAEKSISVSNIVAGTTRLQPVVLLVGQAVGALAATAIKNNQDPAKVNVRKVQQALLNSKAYLLPYIDVKPSDKYFEAIQKIGVTGILMGKGLAYKWANQTWFYPDSTIKTANFIHDFKTFMPLTYTSKNDFLSIEDLFSIIAEVKPSLKTSPTWQQQYWGIAALNDFNLNRPVKRFEIAVLLNKLLTPFESRPINIKGNFIN